MKKVLVITYDFPYPTNSGGKSRIYNLLKFSKSNDLEISLYSFTRPSFKQSSIKEIEKIGVKKVYTKPRKKVKDIGVLAKTLLGTSSIFKHLYYSKEVENEIITIIQDEKIDTVLFESFYTSFYISKKLKEVGVTQIFGTENIEHMLYYDFAKKKPTVIRKGYLVQVSRLQHEEEKAYKMSDRILAITGDEKKYISSQTKSEIDIIPNGVDTKELAYKVKKTSGKNLLFVGNFSYFPNVDAMKFFYHEVFLKIPDVTLTVIGKNQDALPFLELDTRIKNVEYIEDIKDAYYDADIFIFPVRYGGGTNFKVLEAASCGTPIIAIPDRVKGLGFTEDKEFISATTASDFIRSIQEVLHDKKLSEKVSKNARSLVEKEYNWKQIGEKLHTVLVS